MTEAHDLVTRLLAAIEETERIARAATGSPWRIDPQRPNVILEPGPIDWVGVTGHRRDTAPVFTGQVASRYDQADRDAVHIVRQEPKATLIGCAADRKIVELHSPEQAGDVGPPRCRTCHGESWILDEGEDSGGTVYQEAQWRGEPHPCATLLALAERYDLAEQRQDQP